DGYPPLPPKADQSAVLQSKDRKYRHAAQKGIARDRQRLDEQVARNQNSRAAQQGQQYSREIGGLDQPARTQAAGRDKSDQGRCQSRTSEHGDELKRGDSRGASPYFLN